MKPMKKKTIIREEKDHVKVLYDLRRFTRR